MLFGAHLQTELLFLQRQEGFRRRDGAFDTLKSESYDDSRDSCWRKHLGSQGPGVPSLQIMPTPQENYVLAPQETERGIRYGVTDSLKRWRRKIDD